MHIFSQIFKKKLTKKKKKSLLELSLSSSPWFYSLSPLFLKWNYWLILCFIVLFYWKGEFLLKQPFYLYQRFPFQKIDFHTNGILTNSRFLKMINLPKKGNLLDINLLSVTQSLEKFPLIKEVKIEKVFPFSLNVKVTERIPIAKIRDNKGNFSYVLDSEGVFLANNEKWQIHHLPEIVLPKKEIQKEGEVLDLQWQFALQLVSHFLKNIQNSEWLPLRVSLKNQHLIEMESKDGIRVFFGAENQERQIQDYSLIRKEMQNKGKKISSINLLPKKNIPIKFVQ